MRTIPISRLLIVLASLLLIAGLLITAWQFRSNGSEPSNPANPVVATVGTRLITLRDIEQAAALPLYQADQHRSHLLHQALQQKIEETLLEAEASRKGVSVSQLLAEASRSETIARLANLPAPVKRLKPDTTQDNPDHGSPQDLQEQDRIRQALLVSLRRKADIRITLESPAPVPTTLLQYRRQRPPIVRVSRVSFGNTTTSCLNDKLKDQDGTLLRWRKNWG